MDIYKQLIKEILYEGVNSAIKRFEGKADPLFIKWIGLYVDPSPTKKYTEWYINFIIDHHPQIFENQGQYAKAGNIEEFKQAFSPAIRTFTNFMKLCSKGYIKGKEADIWSYEDYVSLVEKINSAGELMRAKEMNKEKRTARKVQLKDLLIVYPENELQSMAYGKGTKWCISAFNANQFNRYYKDWKIMFVIKGNEKWALLQSRYSNDTTMVYNSADVSISWDIFVKGTEFPELLTQTFFNRAK